ncbi:MAG: glycosyltransferase family 4 protein [Thermoguttaceae bacterium]|nr:glycosyltransferase family 4 protein [Thermoguttaceae bacterium]
MKFLFLSSYYKPESTSSSRRTRDLHEAIVARGNSIELYCPTPTRNVSKEVRREYKKRKRETEYDGAMTVCRFSLWREGNFAPLRALRYAVCELIFVWKGLRAKNVDVLASGSTPPIHALTAVFLRKTRGIPFVYYLADIFPDSLVSAGIARKNSLLWKIGNWVSNTIYQNASKIIVISDRQKARLVERGVPAEKVEVIYLWVDENSVRRVERSDNKLFDDLGLPRDKFYVTYAGNFGASQNVELLLDCADKLRGNDAIRFVIIGDGSQKQKLIDKIANLKLDNVTLAPMQPPERVPEVYSLGDVSFVICQKGVGDGAFPSKAAVVMSVGTPLVASYDRDTDLCDLIVDNEAGLCVEPNDVDAAVDAIERLLHDPNLRARCSENEVKLAREKFSKEKSVPASVEIYERVARENKEAKDAKRRR